MNRKDLENRRDIDLFYDVTDKEIDTLIQGQKLTKLIKKRIKLIKTRYTDKSIQQDGGFTEYGISSILQKLLEESKKC